MVAPGRADLHMHTTASDGWPTPQELVDHAARRASLHVIAVTDHDTIEGALRAREHAAKRGRLHVIVGEEVSSRDGHIVTIEDPIEFLHEHRRSIVSQREVGVDTASFEDAR